jgi:hypothetical protein
MVITAQFLRRDGISLREEACRRSEPTAAILIAHVAKSQT